MQIPNHITAGWGVTAIGAGLSEEAAPAPSLPNSSMHITVRVPHCDPRVVTPIFKMGSPRALRELLYAQVRHGAAEPRHRPFQH